jgi:hypothetical protein
MEERHIRHKIRLKLKLTNDAAFLCNDFRALAVFFELPILRRICHYMHCVRVGTELQ